MPIWPPQSFEQPGVGRGLEHRLDGIEAGTNAGDCREGGAQQIRFPERQNLRVGRQQSINRQTTQEVVACWKLWRLPRSD